MTIIKCIASAAVLAFLSSLVLILWKPPQGSGVFSQSGAEIIAWVILLVVNFFFFLFPCLVIGSVVNRKSLTESQKAGMLIAMFISFILFTLPLEFILNFIARHK